MSDMRLTKRMRQTIQLVEQVLLMEPNPYRNQEAAIDLTSSTFQFMRLYFARVGTGPVDVFVSVEFTLDENGLTTGIKVAKSMQDRDDDWDEYSVTSGISGWVFEYVQPHHP